MISKPLPSHVSINTKGPSFEQGIFDLKHILSPSEKATITVHVTWNRDLSIVVNRTFFNWSLAHREFYTLAWQRAVTTNRLI